MEFLHIGRLFGFSIGNSRTAVGMILSIIFGRAEVNPGIAAGTFSGFLVPLRSRRFLGWPGGRLLLSRAPTRETFRQCHQRDRTQNKDIVAPKSSPLTKNKGQNGDRL